MDKSCVAGQVGDAETPTCRYHQNACVQAAYCKKTCLTETFRFVNWWYTREHFLMMSQLISIWKMPVNVRSTVTRHPSRSMSHMASSPTKDSKTHEWPDSSIRILSPILLTWSSSFHMRNSVFSFLNKGYLFISMCRKNVALLHVFYGSRGGMQYRRDVRYEWQDFVCKFYFQTVLFTIIMHECKNNQQKQQKQQQNTSKQPQ